MAKYIYLMGRVLESHPAFSSRLLSPSSDQALVAQGAINTHLVINLGKQILL